MARELGNSVKRWLIINEPRCVAWSGHLTGIDAPGLKNLDLALKVSHHLLLAQGKAIQTLRNIGQDFQIGTIVNLNVVHPINDDDKNWEAVKKLDEFLNRWYIDPIFKGEYPPLAKVAGLTPKREELDLIQQSLDFLGVNYYTRLFVTYDPAQPLTQARVIGENSHTTEMGWKIYPNGLYEILTRLRQEYGDPVLYVTENGAAFEDKVIKDGLIQDDDRIAFLRDHFAAAYRAIQDGVRLKGYFVWTFTDNFEWAKGYSKRFGLVHVNFRTLTRSPKKSFYWYKHVIANNGLTLL